jgi:hypothetical protein
MRTKVFKQEFIVEYHDDHGNVVKADQQSVIILSDDDKVVQDVLDYAQEKFPNADGVRFVGGHSVIVGGVFVPSGVNASDAAPEETNSDPKASKAPANVDPKASKAPGAAAPSA